MTSSKSYFDAHAHVHDYHKDPDFYRPLVAYLQNMVPPIRLLDLGCGDGSFIKSIIKEGIRGNFVGIDISNSMMQTARNQLQGCNVNLILADGFNLPLMPHYQFEFIHLDSILHHLVGKTQSSSKKLANDMLTILLAKLSEEGVMMVEEMFYESNIFPGFTSSIIFYGLKLINFLKLDLSRLASTIIPGLEVRFYSERELESILGQYGEVKTIKRTRLRTSKLQRLFLQKEYGHVSLIVRRKTKSVTPLK
jgi:SAM-dependent methyltransferase